jgi:hypothetical protein
MAIDLTNEPVECPRCGSAIIAVEPHQQWHRDVDEALRVISAMTVDTAAALELLADHVR